MSSKVKSMHVYLYKSTKKPNSTLHKITNVHLTNQNEIITYIPNEGHNLQEHFVVMVKGGKTKDLSSVKYLENDEKTTEV